MQTLVIIHSNLSLYLLWCTITTTLCICAPENWFNLFEMITTQILKYRKYKHTFVCALGYVFVSDAVCVEFRAIFFFSSLIAMANLIQFNVIRLNFCSYIYLFIAFTLKSWNEKYLWAFITLFFSLSVTIYFCTVTNNFKRWLSFCRWDWCGDNIQK